MQLLNNMDIYIYLESKGFYLLKNEKGNSFGDYYDVFTNNIFVIRLIKDKSIETIDVQSSLDNNGTWYDLALVKGLLHNESQLNYTMSIEQYCVFLINNIENINSLFDKENYLLTESRLKELGWKRAKQMFPSFDIDGLKNQDNRIKY
jgi:hypothetical protein